MEIYEADTIERYNRYFGFETRHPLVSIVHFDDTVEQPTHCMHFGFYALFLKKTTGCRINYGKTTYDFDDETVVSFAPGQTVGIHRLEDGPAPEAIGLLFHPDFLNRTPLGQKMKQYSFFSYASNEALHLSSEERLILQDYMEKIRRELLHPIDKFTKSLIVSNIEVMLNYCMRFYERQFITREELNNSTMSRFESLLDEYLDKGTGKVEGIPTVKYFADKVCLSPNYFGDLVKAETGKTAQEFIHLKMINHSKSYLLDPLINTKQIAEQLGFQHPQHFIRCYAFCYRMGLLGLFLLHFRAFVLIVLRGQLCRYLAIEGGKFGFELLQLVLLAPCFGDIRKTVKKYEILASHCGRRTFTTLCLRKGMSPEDIRAVTGHTTAGMMMKYVKFDDESKREKMNLLNNGESHGVETVFDHAISDDERMCLGIPTKETYLEICEGDTASVNVHLAVLAHIRGNLQARANYIKRLPADKLNEVLEIIMRIVKV